MSTATTWRRFAGFNIKGTPAMPAASVAHDLDVAQSVASVLVFQEFRWPWYWRTLQRVMGDVADSVWRSAPGMLMGARKPVWGAQAVLWKRKVWRRIDTRVALLHDGEAGISESRYLRAVLLEDRATGLRCWFGTTHFVVKGDATSDTVRRRLIMTRDLNALDNFLHALTRTGHPVVFQMDANIHTGTPAYTRLRATLSSYRGVIHGRHGVEYLFTLPGARAGIEVKGDFEVPTTRLKTDHEARGITFRLTPPSTR